MFFKKGQHLFIQQIDLKSGQVMAYKRMAPVHRETVVIDHIHGIDSEFFPQTLTLGDHDKDGAIIPGSNTIAGVPSFPETQT